jgi:hypothetical protein
MNRKNTHVVQIKSIPTKRDLPTPPLEVDTEDAMKASKAVTSAIKPFEQGNKQPPKRIKTKWIVCIFVTYLTNYSLLEVRETSSSAASRHSYQIGCLEKYVG